MPLKLPVSALLFGLLLSVGAAAVNAEKNSSAKVATDPTIGRVEIATIPFAPELRLRTATYTPSGKVLVAYAKDAAEGRRFVNLAVMDDDGSNMRPLFSGQIPERKKDNGIRFMVFPDNRRIFLGDFIIECAPDIDACEGATLLPVEYPPEVAGGDHVTHRWSEIIVAPDNEHIAWTTLFADYSAAVFTGTLERREAAYTINNPLIITTLEAFRPDPDHPGGVIPNAVRNGEVKQFVTGGTAISMVGAKNRDTADSVVLHLPGGEIEQITDTPGYDETTIFSPDEKLGIVMTTRFSDPTNLAILGLMPRPYPASLNMGFSMHMYIYAVAGVRAAREGNIGPALIDIASSKTVEGYRGINLNTEDKWVYHSPMSWHPDGKKAMWLEGLRGGKMRMQLVRLLDYRPAAPVAAASTPEEIPYATGDLSAIDEFLRHGKDVDVKVYGQHSGHIEYRRTAAGFVEKIYTDFSDDGKAVYSGQETMQVNPGGYSTYQAGVKLSGPKPGVMELKITFGPLRGELPARIVFDEDPSGAPLSHGYALYNGQRLNVEDLVP